MKISWLIILLFMLPYSHANGSFETALPKLGLANALNANGEIVTVNASFVGGISINGRKYQKQVTLNPTDTFSMIGQIGVAPEHIGQVADIVVVVGFAQTEQFFMLDNKGNALLWQGLENLVAFKEKTTLDSHPLVPIYIGQLKLSGAVLRVWFGYRLQDGMIVYNSHTLDIAFNDTPLEEQLQAMLQAQTDQGIPSMSLYVNDPNQGEWSLSSGLAPTARFRVGSVTKTFTAATVLSLAEEGLLGLDDSIEKYLPDMIPNGKNITIRQLLNHTSGLDEYLKAIDVYDDIERVWTPKELVAAGVSLGPLFAPGENWMYSNTGYIVLGLLIEAVTHSSYEQAIQTRFIEPLGLTNTLVPKAEEADMIPGNHARGYWDYDEDGELDDVTEINQSAAWSAGIMISNSEDLGRWSQALYRSEILNDDSMFSNFIDFGGPFLYGLGTMFYPERGLIGHSGNIDGYTAGMFYLPEHDVAVTALGNLDSANETVMRTIFDALDILGYPSRAKSLYLTMSDGVKIAVDVVLPYGYKAEVPSIMLMTRYHRLEEGRYNREIGEFFTLNGYAYVLVDARGSGASFGTRPHPFSAKEIADYGEIVDWIVKQPWSNGRVGAEGVSYEGNTAIMVANHPAVKAVIPRFYDFDIYRQTIMPGGIFNDVFMKLWSEENIALDTEEGVKPVTDKLVLKAALKEHQNNADVYQFSQHFEFIDSKEQEITIQDISPCGLESSGTALFTWASWLDAGTAAGAISQFQRFSNPQTVIIGPWSHGAEFDSDPFLPPETAVQPNLFEQASLMLAFFDNFLKEEGDSSLDKEIIYYTLGEGQWKTTPVWPPKGFSSQKWYFGDGNALTKTQPVTGSDQYQVDFTATSGHQTRWHTQLGGNDVIYPDRQEQDKKLLTYTTAPLENNLEITGTPVVNIAFSATTSDGAFFVYLEDVAPDGKVTYITEGMLRLIHRKPLTEQSECAGEYHSFKQADAAPLVPGKADTASIGLFPTSVLIKKGHRIRIAIAGHDAAMFRRYPAAGTPEYTIYRHSGSFLELPVKVR
jgi:putative CocE/NonD family hydrolase